MAGAVGAGRREGAGACAAAGAASAPAPAARACRLDREVIVDSLGGRSRTGGVPLRAGPRSAQRPLLVGLPVAGPQLDGGPVGGGGSRDVQAQAGLDAG